MLLSEQGCRGSGWLEIPPEARGATLEQFAIFSWWEICWNRCLLGTEGKVKEFREKNYLEHTFETYRFTVWSWLSGEGSPKTRGEKESPPSGIGKWGNLGVLMWRSSDPREVDSSWFSEAYRMFFRYMKRDKSFPYAITVICSEIHIVGKAVDSLMPWVIVKAWEAKHDFGLNALTLFPEGRICRLDRDIVSKIEKHF